MLVCQRLFNCQRKNKKIIYADVYLNTINDGDSLREGGRLRTGYYCHWSL